MAKQNEQQPASSDSPSLRGMTKAAILLVSMEGDCSAAILRQLDTELVENITREIAQLDLVAPEVRSQVIEEFYSMALARQYVKQGGIPYARVLLEKALPPDQAVIAGEEDAEPVGGVAGDMGISHGHGRLDNGENRLDRISRRRLTADEEDGSEDRPHEEAAEPGHVRGRAVHPEVPPVVDGRMKSYPLAQ